MKKVSPTKRSFRWIRHIPLPRPVQDLLWEHCPINGRISGLFWTAFLNPCMRKIFQSVKGQIVINPKKFYYITFITPRRCDLPTWSQALPLDLTVQVYICCLWLPRFLLLWQLQCRALLLVGGDCWPTEQRKHCRVCNEMKGRAICSTKLPPKFALL